MRYRQFAWVMLMVSLLVGIPACQQKRENGQAERLPVVIEFALPSGTDASGKLDKTVMDEARKKAEEAVLMVVGEEARSSIRRFRLLPIFSLEVDPKTVARLLQLPEVESIRLDREVEILSVPDSRPR